MMSEPPLHPKLTQANIAFFKGERAETLRLLDEYQQEESNQQQGMVLWLRAQTQTDLDTRMEHLHALVNAVHEDDAYTKITREYLQLEALYKEKLNPPRKNRGGIRLLLLLGVMVILIGGGAFIGASLLWDGEAASAETALNTGQTAETEITPATATPLPDKSQELPLQDYSARYQGGILQVAAVEIGSERVIRAGGTGTNDAVIPVDGAHFYALRLIFECRSGVCNAPPEAELALELTNTDLIAARPDVVIAGEDTFAPIALGRTTSGWVVFEIPLVGKVEGLLIIPAAEDQESVSIRLGIPESE